MAGADHEDHSGDDEAIGDPDYVEPYDPATDEAPAGDPDHDCTGEHPDDG